MIDAHHHFWAYDPAEYGWIGPGMEALRRDFLPGHLRAEIDRAGVEGVVSVQARQTLAESDWLLQLAEGNDFIRGVVGWVPLVSPGVRADLQRLAAHPKFKGVRHVLQDEPDDRLMDLDAFNRGVALLPGLGLRYDLLIFERHLPAATRFVDRHPHVTFVLDHVAKPRIRENVLEPWRTHIRDLAERPNVYCKISGMATEADCATWTPAQLKPYLDTVLEAFGPRRLMFGSDWPVALLATDYPRWAGVVRDAIAALSPTERERIERGTAVEAYGL